MSPSPRARRWIGVGLLLAVTAPWAMLAIVYRFFEPSRTEWMLLVAVTAVITEAALWIGAAWLGFSALRRLSFIGSLFGQGRRTGPQ